MNEFPSDDDVRLWSTDMPGNRAHGWHRVLEVNAGGGIERDLEWCAANDWKVGYYADGTRVFEAHGVRFTVEAIQ